jgi:predicted Zn finger-like uncharacterized protein
MRTKCPFCQTVYDDKKILPEMSIQCSRCNQIFKAFPLIQLSTVVVEDPKPANPKAAMQKERKSYLGNYVLCSILKWTLYFFTFLASLAIMDLAVLFFLAPVAAVISITLVLILIAVLYYAYKKIAGTGPGLLYPFLIGGGLSLFTFLIRLSTANR